MRPAAARRGQPLVALVALLGGWVAMRAMMWDASAIEAGRAEATTARQPMALFAASGAKAVKPTGIPVRSHGGAGHLPASVLPQAVSQAPPAPIPAPVMVAPVPTETPPGISPPIAAPEPLPSDDRVAMAAGHQLLWMAAVSQLPLPAGLLSSAGTAPLAVRPARAGAPITPQVRRWSADAWLMLRRGGEAALALGGLAPSYGASQVGAVIRYRLAPSSANRPSAYLRATAALNGSGERTAALGLSARPIARVPIVVAAEARLDRRPGGTRLRPAAMIVSEFPPAALPLGLRAEGYFQAGFVGGPDATAFADGQFRLDRRVAHSGSFELRAGGGAWAGAQKDASRVDVGPTASLDTSVAGRGRVRVGLDWRIRVAGNAAPGSGAALTVSAGF